MFAGLSSLNTNWYTVSTIEEQYITKTLFVVFFPIFDALLNSNYLNRRTPYSQQNLFILFSSFSSAFRPPYSSRSNLTTSRGGIRYTENTGLNNNLITGLTYGRIKSQVFFYIITAHDQGSWE